MTHRSRGALFFVVTLLLASWHLDHSRGDNAVSRAAMVSAIVDHGELRIDRYHALTGDKALVDGHYYSEKAPLPSLLVVPVYGLARRTGLIGAPPPETLPDVIIPLGAFLCGSLPFALLVFAAFRRSSAAGRMRHPAAFPFITFFGSFLFLYSGTFFGHLWAALFTVLAWQHRERKNTVLSGLLLSTAVLCEYTLVVFPLAWALQDLARSRWPEVGRLTLGGLPGVALLLVMNAAITGDPFSLPYAHVAGYEGPDGGMGLTWPTWTAVRGLLWGPYRGLLWYAPVTVLILVAGAMARRGRSLRDWSLDPLVVPASVLVLLIGSLSMWWGGWAYGPRHLTVIAALLFVAGLPQLPDRPWVHGTFSALGAIGLLLALAAKSTVWGAFPSDVPDPIRHVLLPAVRSGAWTQPPWSAALGFSPGAAALAFVSIFVLALVLFVRMDRQCDHDTA